jgi:hypothetical protein
MNLHDDDNTLRSNAAQRVHVSQPLMSILEDHAQIGEDWVAIFPDEGIEKARCCRMELHPHSRSSSSKGPARTSR